ncbi:MAG: diguanylate cyclase [Deltaproteobacteria bacterium]|nr:diguanylate cyclase [Deltaproteobacteria bacterium]
MEDILRANGYQTRYALDGKDGIKLASEWNPSVILLDLIMPEMDGVKVCKELRRLCLRVRPSIIIVSVKGDKETVVDLLSKGADDFIAKPYNEAEFMARVKAQMRISGFYRELDEDKKNLESILAITEAVTATLDPNEVLDIIVRKVAEATGALRCSIVLIVKGDEGYVLVSNDNPSIREMRLDLSKYPEIKEVISSKNPLVLEDMATHPIMSPVRERIKDLKDMSLVIVPIVFNEDVLGTLFLRTRKNKNGFSRKELDFCRIVANASFHAIKNANLFERVSKEKEYLKELVIKDQLTTLYNHNFFYSRLAEEFDRSVRYETQMSIIMMDIDNFKHINDTYGHRVGDVVLREVGALIKKGVRKTDIVARYGGEEFSVILPQTAIKGAAEEADRLRQLIESHAYAGLAKEKITVSLGVASYPHKDIMHSGDMVTAADDALYKAKHEGRNRVKVAWG